MMILYDDTCTNTSVIPIVWRLTISQRGVMNNNEPTYDNCIGLKQWHGVVLRYIYNCHR